ncbi:HgcAB-like fusion protein [Candidatus Harpocratesius sp.]
MSIKKKFRTIYGSPLKLFAGYLFRWIGFPIEPQLVKIGQPTEYSPVLITCNFNLTVFRVLKAIQELDCWLLIAPSNGINVWCGACGDDFLTESVISIIKTSKIEEKVSHRTLILPQLSATGIDPIEIKNKTGWNAIFGPVYAKDIPDYLNNQKIKTPLQREVNFPLSARLEMGNLYFFSVFFILSIIYVILNIFIPFLDKTLYVQLIGMLLIMIYIPLITVPYFSFKTGKMKLVIFEIGILLLIIIIWGIIWFNPIYLAWNSGWSLLFFLLMSEDLHGLTPIFKSELGEATWKKGKEKMEFLGMQFKLNPYGEITFDETKCIGCGMCKEVCPKNIYTLDENRNKIVLTNPEKCINCNACIRRCPTSCLQLIPEKKMTN